MLLPCQAALALDLTPLRSGDELLKEVLAEPEPYNPWLAAGLNYLPTTALLGGLLAYEATRTPFNPISMGYGLQFSGYLAGLNPLPGLGHVYVNEPLRGLALSGANLLVLFGLGTLNPPLALGLSAAFSACIAGDAFVIASTKNLEHRRKRLGLELPLLP